MIYRVVFFGTSDFSVPSLKSLIDDKRFNVVGVVTKPDALVGRKQQLTSPIIKIIAEENNIPVCQPNKIRKNERLVQQLENWLADVFVVVSYGKILPQKVLNIPKQGVVNVHGSLLPSWRGASCVQSAIVNGDDKTGITIMKMDAEMDHGDIIKQFDILIDNVITAGELHDKLAMLGGEKLPDVLFDYLQGKIAPVPQDHEKATYCNILKKEDGEINWSNSAEKIVDFIRGFTPWPTAWTKYNNKRIKILKAKVVKLSDDKQFLEGAWFIKNGRLFVACGNKTIIEILELQLEEKRKMLAKEFLTGQAKLFNQV